MTHTVFRPGKTDYENQPAFFGAPISTARYDKLTEPFWDDMTERQHSVFWRPQEVDLATDRIDYRKLDDNQKHIFISNLKYQTLLDSIQGRNPAEAFLPIASLPEVECWIDTWTFSESIHSRSYTHIMRTVLTDAEMDAAFNDITLNEDIRSRAKVFTDYFDIHIQNVRRFQDPEGTKEECQVTEDEVMRSFLRAWVATNALEAVSFYVSFACSWAFAERDLMEGNAKIIKLIAKDESIHLTGTEYYCNLIRSGKAGTRLGELWHEMRDELHGIFDMIRKQEHVWAAYLMKDGGMLGLTEGILVRFIDVIAAKRMEAVGLFDGEFEVPDRNPLPWFNQWCMDEALDSKSDAVQVAPQEAEIESYKVGSIDSDVGDLGDFEL